MSTYEFTVAVAFQNVERYFGAMLKSLQRQTYGVDRLQIVLIDDGSTDRSYLVAEKWARGRENVTLLRQEASGPATARNHAIDIAKGTWFTTIDADDIIGRDYFAAVSDLLRRDVGDAASILTARIYLLDDETGRFRDRHPLAHKYRFGDRLASLDEEPEAFILGSPFLRTAVLQGMGLRYDPRVRPTFEDAHLIGRYLSNFDEPVMGIVAKAHYYYRKRASNDSLVQSSWSLEDRFTSVLEHGYLDLLQGIHTQRGHVPRWAQYMVLYDLFWYFKEEQALHSKVGWVGGELAERFNTLVEQVIAFLDEESILLAPCNPTPWVVRQALVMKFKQPSGLARVYRWSTDSAGLLHATVLHREESVEVQTFSAGLPVSHTTKGMRLHRFYDDDYMYETSISWPGDAEPAIWVNGVPQKMRKLEKPSWRKPTPGRHKLTVAPAARVTSGRFGKIQTVVDIAALCRNRSKFATLFSLTSMKADRLRAQVRAKRRRDWVESVRQDSTSAEVQDRYHGAWLIMDRPWSADDNGEHLYRYIRSERPEINAYFLLEKSSPHWDRLAADGFRLLEWGSREATLAALNATVRASSDAIEACMYPAPRREFGQPQGIFVFLQHGVLKDDISRWLNGKQIDLLITTTEAEYQSFVGPRSPYTLMRSEVARTGLSRYDRLLDARESSGGGRSILVMPTWRRGLRESLERCASDAERARVFEESEFGRAWLSILRSTQMEALAARSGQKIRLMWHPLIERALPMVDLPEYVQKVDPAFRGFQHEIAETSVLLTDYSSIAFDAAYIGVPVVYYQFDAATMFDGSHPLRRGYFEYERDGVGPVCQTADGALVELFKCAAAGFALSEPYRTRVAESFPMRDGNNSKRVVEAIELRLKEVGY